MPMTFGVEPDDSSPRRFLLRGELDLAGVDALAAAVEASAEAGGDVVFDLTDLSFIDSSGINAFIRVARGLEGNGRLVLLAPRPEVLRILTLVGLENLPNIDLRQS